MSSRTLYRLSGVALLVGSLLLIVHAVLIAVLYPGHTQTSQQILSSTWTLVVSIGLVGFLLFAAGLPGMYLRQAARAGVLGFVGFVLIFVAVLLGGVSFTAIDVAIFPYLAQSIPNFGTAGPPLAAGLLLILGPFLLLAVGAILLGIASIRARVFPRWAGILLLAEVGLLIAFPLPDTVNYIIDAACNVIFFLAFGWCGYVLMAQGKEPVASPSLATPAAQTSH